MNSKKLMDLTIKKYEELCSLSLKISEKQDKASTFKVSKKKGENIFDWDILSIEVREDILKILSNAGSGHTGGSLSLVEILLALYYGKMRFKPENPKWPDRDRLILSKGHAASALYVILARQGFFDPSELERFRRMGGSLQGHPCNCKTPGVEISTGSLGQGLSVANGIALAGKLDRRPYKVYVILGDGEIQEGQVWEGAMTASRYHLDNLCAIIDYNKLQIDGPVCQVMGIEPLEEKWRAFGWATHQVNGHDIKDILKALDSADGIKDKPTVIICHTVKGKGVSFMENKVCYHGVAPTQEELEQALAELSNKKKLLIL